MGRWTAAALGALIAWAPAAADDPTARGFDPDPVRQAFSIDGDFAVETATTAEPGDWRASVGLQWVEGLLALTLGDDRDMLLESRLSLNLAATRSIAVPILGRVEIGAHFPVALYQASDFSLLEDLGVSGPLVEPIATTAPGDLRLGAKATLLELSSLGLALGAVADLRLPTGNPDAFTSDGLAFLPSGVLSGAWGRFRVDGQLGYLFRGEGQYAQLVIHDGWSGGLGVAVKLPPAGRLDTWKAIAEMTAMWPRGAGTSGERYRTAASARAGLRATLGPRTELEVGGGAGLGEPGYGREAWRVFASVRFTPLPPGYVPPPEPEKPTPPLPPVRTEAEPAGSDLDGDGVLTPLDLCPDLPGTLEMDGCPDRDNDTIPDPQDECPDVPGPALNEGCPPKEDEPLVEIETERLSLRDAIAFDFGKDTIKPESDRLLNQIATLLSQHPEVTQIRVEGHTDNIGSRPYNLDLSQRRATSVVRALVARGVKRGVLFPMGFGFDRPVASNDTALGRAKNRRVEFVVVAEGDEGPPK
jgi:outer membrane protein OmpA-like peptidoglycan-associated protein